MPALIGWPLGPSGCEAADVAVVEVDPPVAAALDAARQRRMHLPAWPLQGGASDSQLKSKNESPFIMKNDSSSLSAALTSAPAVPAGAGSTTTSTSSWPKRLPA